MAWQERGDVLLKPLTEEKLATLLAADGEPEPQPDAESGSSALEGSGTRILLADDNAVNRMFIGALLRQRGYEVTAVVDGLEAVREAERGDFDLILMDLQMPHLDGLAATRTIRESQPPTGPHLPIVALTANAEEGDRERCLAAGMDGYLSKPIAAAELYEALKVITSSTGNDA